MIAGVTHGRESLHRDIFDVKHFMERGHCGDGVLASVNSQQGIQREKS